MSCRSTTPSNGKIIFRINKLLIRTVSHCDHMIIVLMCLNTDRVASSASDGAFYVWPSS